MNKKRLSRKLSISWALIVMMVIIGLGISHPAEAYSPSFPSGVPLERTETEAYWDDFFQNGMKVYGVHGAEMVIVQEGEILFAKGYGFADTAGETPLDPQTTIVRAGSIAKTLTALAVLQLADRGDLDLDVDINQYLMRFKIPGNFPEPVTARHLINMTGGFDTRAIGIRASSRKGVEPLGEYLAEHMPPRVLPPGRYRRYNDHELALAGYLVEVVSGMPYEEYVRKNIFEPLEMKNSSVLLPDAQMERAARGYPVGGDAEQAFPRNYYYLNTAPGAGFNTTAIDMAHYLMVYLQEGQYTQSSGSQARLMSEAASRSMLETSFSYDPSLPGTANSFDERLYKGRRYLRKLGGAPGMQNNLILMPDAGLGFYLFTNTEGTGLRNDWEQAVAERYQSNSVLSAGMRPVQTESAVPENRDMSSFSGTYQEISDYTSDTTIVQVRALFNPDVWVAVEGGQAGGLQVWGKNFNPVGQKVFEDSLSGNRIAFETNQNGYAEYLFLARTAYRRVNQLQTPAVQMALLGFAVVVFLLSSLIAFLRIRRAGSGENRTLILTSLVSGLNLFFLVALAALLLPIATGGDIWQFSFEPSLALRAILALPVVTTGLSILLLADIIIAARWMECANRFTLLFGAFTLAGVTAFLLFLDTWKLLGWRF